MKRAVKFYRDVLGLKVVEEDDGWSSMDVGGVRVGLHANVILVEDEEPASRVDGIE
jgi:catechol 2,3-dioxygenase-like lactoylglutathione lyase family enzyme